MKTVTDEKKIREVLDRGIIADVIPSRDELLKFLIAGNRLKIYIGMDPTATSLHLGHAGNLMFLEDLRKLGHEVILLVGDFTARIGDPSGRTTARVPLTEQQIKANMKDWKAQIKPILGVDDKRNPARFLKNSTWLSKLKLADILNLQSNFTVQQMIERDMFEKRWKEDVPIYLHEFMYPLMQGYDSVAMDVNAELCGTDQLFNALAGRTLVKRLKQKDKFVIALKLLQNPKTGEMMSKSKGTGVFLAAEPAEMFGALMAQPDEMTETLFVHCTRLPLSEKSWVMALGARDAKARVAFEIVKIMHGEKAAKKAQAEFEAIFSKKELPSDLPELKLNLKSMAAIDVVVASGVVSSKSEARRLIEQGGFQIDCVTVKNPQEQLLLQNGRSLKVGKKHFFRVKV